MSADDNPRQDVKNTSHTGGVSRINLLFVLGEELRKARNAAGLTQEELAAKAHITREYVSHLEREEYSPTVDVLLRVCKALGIKSWVILRRLERQNHDK